MYLVLQNYSYHGSLQLKPIMGQFSHQRMDSRYMNIHNWNLRLTKIDGLIFKAALQECDVPKLGLISTTRDGFSL